MINWQAQVLAPCLAVFGEPATYTPAAGAPFGIHGVFDNAYAVVTISEHGVEVTTLYPVLGVNLAEFASPPAQGDQVQIGRTGKTYAVRDPRPDSHGGALLVLNYVSG